MTARDGFVHLHLHTQYSLLDGAIKLAPLFEQVRALGQRAVGMTDHGNLFGAAEFHEKARAAGVKPLIGCETYIATGSRFEKEKRAQDKSGFDAINHLLLIAMDQTGYRNLMTLVSKGYLEGFYYKPRIDLELLRQHSEGLIATSGCLSSMICRALGSGETKRAWELAEDFARIFPGRFYVELQRHGIELQQRVEKELLKIAADLRLPLVATNDAHYLHAHDHGPHEALLCIGTGTTLGDPARFRFDGKGFHVKSAAEMAEVFSDLPQALSNSVEIAERCNLELQMGVYQMPEFQVPQGTTREAVLREQSWLGLRKHLALAPDAPFAPAHQAYTERLQMELDTICKMGFAGYFLIVADFIAHARDHGIPVGPGRGSSAGSLVTYSLGITGVNPLEYDILFERFLNPERISMPDIDVDFCMRGRDQVIEYVRRKYDGEGHAGKRVAQIITFGKLQAKAAIRDVGRVLGMSFGDVDRIAKLVPDVLGMTLQEAIDASPELRAKSAEEPQVKQLLDTALSLEGLTRHASTHAAGVVIGNRPLIDLVPLYRDPKSGEVVTQFDMNMVERIGLVKFDFLGLRTLTVIADAEKLVRANGHPDFSVASLPMDDKKTYELFAKGDTEGVFQMESSGMTELATKLKPKVFREIIPLIALYRTGPIESGALQEYVDRKLGMARVEYFLPQFEEVTKETLGVIVYQDQVLQIANRVSGYSLGEADFLRRAMGKKKPEEMEKQRERFVSGAVAQGRRRQEGAGALRDDREVRGLRLPEGALDRLRADHLPDRVPEGEPPARVPGGAPDDRVGQHRQARQVHRPRARPRHSRAGARAELVGARLHRRSTEGIRFGFAGVKNVGEAAIEAILEQRTAGGAVHGPVRLRPAHRLAAREQARAREPDQVRRVRLHQGHARLAVGRAADRARARAAAAARPRGGPGVAVRCRRAERRPGAARAEGVGERRAARLREGDARLLRHGPPAARARAPARAVHQLPARPRARRPRAPARGLDRRPARRAAGPEHEEGRPDGAGAPRGPRRQPRRRVLPQDLREVLGAAPGRRAGPGEGQRGRRAGAAGAPRRRDPPAGRRLEPAHQPDRGPGRAPTRSAASGCASCAARSIWCPGASRSASSWRFRAGQSRSSIFRVIVCGCRRSW